MKNVNVADLNALYGNVEILEANGVVSNISTDAKSAYSRHEDFNFRSTVTAAMAGDIDAAIALRTHIAGLYEELAGRHETIRKEYAAKNQKDAKEAARVNWELNRRGLMLKALNDVVAKNVVYEYGIISRMKAGEVIDAEEWSMFEDHTIDKTCRVDGPFSTNDLIRLLQIQGVGVIRNVIGNATLVAIEQGFAFNIAQKGEDNKVVTKTYVLSGKRAYEILVGKVGFRQNVPYSKLGVMKSSSVPNLDGKSGVVRLSEITGDAQDAETKIRLFWEDFVDQTVVRVHLYAINPVKYKEYKQENDDLAKFFGNPGFIIRGKFDKDFFIFNTSIDKAKNNPDKLALWRQPKGYLGSDKLDEATLSDINLYVADQIRRLADRAESSESVTTQTTAAPAPKAKGKAKLKVTNPDAIVGIGDDLPY